MQQMHFCFELSLKNLQWAKGQWSTELPLENKLKVGKASPSLWRGPSIKELATMKKWRSQLPKLCDWKSVLFLIKKERSMALLHPASFLCNINMDSASEDVCPGGTLSRQTAQAPVLVLPVNSCVTISVSSRRIYNGEKNRIFLNLPPKIAVGINRSNGDQLLHLSTYSIVNTQ